MPSPWLHRAAVLLTVGTLLLIVIGALLSGPTPETSASVRGIHRFTASTVGVLTILTAIIGWKGSRAPMRLLLVFLVIGVSVQGALGAMSARNTLPTSVAVFHACLAHLFFAGTMVLSKITSAGWSRGPEYVADSGVPTMRTLAVITPVLVLAQIALGAAYRHDALGIMPHIVGAMVAGIVILMVALFAMTQFPNHAVLRKGGAHLLGVASVQVLLGVLAYIVRAVYGETGQLPGWAIAMPILHVASGALTLAATLVLSVQIRRNVQPRDSMSSEPLTASQ